MSRINPNANDTITQIGNGLADLPYDTDAALWPYSMEGIIVAIIARAETFADDNAPDSVFFGITLPGGGFAYVLVEGSGLDFSGPTPLGTVDEVTVMHLPFDGPLTTVGSICLRSGVTAAEFMDAVAEVADEIGFQRPNPDFTQPLDVTLLNGRPLMDLIVDPNGSDGLVYSGSDNIDVINTYVTDDSVSAGDLHDFIRLSPGQDTIDGGSGGDTADGRFIGSGAISYNGNSGVLTSGANRTVLIDVERLIGSAFADDLRAGFLTGGLFGDGGDDTLTGSGDGDQLNGGDGHDMLIGRAGGDALDGDAGDDVILGGVGWDLIDGGDGNDSIVAQDGFDTVFGGADDDTIAGNNGFDELWGGSGNDILTGGLGLDTLRGGSGDDSLSGQNGSDTLEGGSGNDTLEGNAGADLLNGGTEDDLLDGGINNDTLQGGDGTDTLLGGTGADDLQGGAGDDILQGNAGADRLDGGAGDDVLRGGIGIDTFVFEAGGGADTVIDFSDGIDRIEIDADLLMMTTPQLGDLAAFAGTNADGNLVLDFGIGQSVTFNNVAALATILDEVVFV